MPTMGKRSLSAFVDPNPPLLTRIARGHTIALNGARDEFPIPLYIISVETFQGSKYRVPHLRPAGTLFSTQVALCVYLHFAQVSAGYPKEFA